MNVSIEQLREAAKAAGMVVGYSTGYRVVSYLGGRGTWYAATSLRTAKARVAELRLMGIPAEVWTKGAPL